MPLVLKKKLRQMECTYFWGGKGGELGIFKHVPQTLLGLVILLGFSSRINTEKNLYQHLGLSKLY